MPGVELDLPFLSLTEIARKIRTREVSSEEATRASVDRARRLGPRLNCFFSFEADDALAQARAADAATARGQGAGALHGVPLAHKDVFFRAGKIATCGARLCRDIVQDETATVLERLGAAGAVSLGALHLPEFAMGPYGDNDHFGQCRNPWNLDRVAG